MLLCCSLLSWAQTTVTGIVFDETNLEVIGANVKEKGTTNGAITNLDGAFSFQVSDPQKAVLEISFIGYESQEVALNGRTNIKINGVDADSFNEPKPRINTLVSSAPG